MLLPQDEADPPDEDSVCRFCWQGSDDGEGGELLAPCRCSGSVKYVHRRCLGAWQRTQRSQGALRKSYRCDICRGRYRVRRAPFSGHKLPFCRLPTWDETKELLISFVDNPAWQLLLDAWKMVVLANGLMHASATGVLGLEKGFWLAWRSVEFYGKMMLQWGPELVMAGAAFPVIQLPVLLLTVGSGALVGMELVGSMMLGWYAGALYGFALGSMQILKTTVDFSGDILAKGVGHLGGVLGCTASATAHFAKGIVPLFKSIGQG